MFIPFSVLFLILISPNMYCFFYMLSLCRYWRAAHRITPEHGHQFAATNAEGLLQTSEDWKQTFPQQFSKHCSIVHTHRLCPFQFANTLRHLCNPTAKRRMHHTGRTPWHLVQQCRTDARSVSWRYWRIGSTAATRRQSNSRRRWTSTATGTQFTNRPANALPITAQIRTIAGSATICI